ncbi:MAG: UDP-N-acetylmuramoyl-L-alanine--D-glutamate ligase [Synergistaceae bacterium]|jgi:UDP-N-acetylmuramoylalanine--D-glutamate ligase|nr:UDP-N-acetylmuramoyl-L-alanine--D-glutamate ligase [Synergistaceae bacterium]
MSEHSSLRGSRVTVLGAGISGVSIALLARRLGASVFVSDAGGISDAAAKTLESAGIPFEQGGHTDRALSGDLTVVGSGFPPSAPIVKKLNERGIEPVGELDFVMPHIGGRVIGITGSNGKTTTTSLLAHLLVSAGVKCAAAGNIGAPIADLAGRDFDFIAMEVSSFQLHWAKRVSLAGAVMTNLAPDHIDWHGSYESYASSKARIFDFVEEGGFSVLQERDAGAPKGGMRRPHFLTWGEASLGNAISLSASRRNAVLNGVELFGFGDTKLLGAHNMENTAMAMAAMKLLGFGERAARSSLSSFSPPPHRCSLVLEKGGVRYIDDSKGTNIAASSAAMSSIEGPHIVILGGRGKGEDYAGLVGPLKKFARRAILIGEASGDIAAALDRGEYEGYLAAGDMESAVKIAAEIAAPGESVLLSPACTSWDSYSNYGERGDHFASLVRRYAREKDDPLR